MSSNPANVPSSAADAVLDALRPVIDGIAATFGRSCEVVLHDYRDPEHGVVAVAGSVTGRRVGSPLSEIGLRLLAAGPDARNEVNYLTRTDDGRLLKCSTMPLRDAGGELIGALCINVDVSALQFAGDFIADLVGSGAADRADLPTTTFAGDFDEVVDALVRQEEAHRSKPITALSRAERLELLDRLRQRGLFKVRGAAPLIAKRLGISRAAVYNDLNTLREEPS